MLTDWTRKPSKTIFGIYENKGVGDVLAGRVDQGIVKPGEEVFFLPTHTASNRAPEKFSPSKCTVTELTRVVNR